MLRRRRGATLSAVWSAARQNLTHRQKLRGGPRYSPPQGATEVGESMQRRKTRVLAVVVGVLALVTAACGSRVPADPSAGGLDGPTTGGRATSTSSPTTSAGAGPDQVGTLKAACGKAKGPHTQPKGAYPDDAKGITADAINIATITDKAGTIKLPTIGIEDAAKGFVEFCNSRGGIDGRKLNLRVYDSKISEHAEATRQACQDDNFAIVMSGSVLETGAQEMVDCKLVEVGAYAASANKSLSDRFFQPVPNRSNRFSVAPCEYFKKQEPTAVKHAAVVYSDLPTAEYRANTVVEGCTKVGYDFVYVKPTAVGLSNWGPVVQEMKNKGVEYLTMVTSGAEAVSLLQAMSDQGFKPKLMDFGAQYYDTQFSQATGVDGAYVTMNTVPFEELDKSPALQVYEKWVRRANGDDAALSSLGVQAFSAGLLFAQAASSVGDDLTREHLITALSKIHKWDGGGLHFLSDPGSSDLSGCFLSMRVEDGRFVRVFPKKGFSCPKDKVIDIKTFIGKGAKEGGG
jgi:ABC-type branched-subunit amino acid transport system substrate-binding protein